MIRSSLAKNEKRESLRAQKCVRRLLSIMAHFSAMIAFHSAEALAQPPSKKAAWGKALFFEPKLSANGKISCATCHEPDRAFTENKSSSTDIEGHSVHRNSPTLINAAHMDVLTWSNPVLRKLENQIIVPLFLDTPGEMALVRVWPRVRSELLEKSPHMEMYRAAFPEEKVPLTPVIFSPHSRNMCAPWRPSIARMIVFLRATTKH